MHLSPSFAFFSLLAFSTDWLPFVSTQSTGNIALYSTSACQSPIFINNFTLGLDNCGNPFNTGDDTLNTTIESYIINERPTCSDGHIPTFYTYKDAACYQGAAERPVVGLATDTSCVVSVQFVAMAFICYGLGNLDGNGGESTGGNNGCGSGGGNEEGNVEGGNYNGCVSGDGTGGNGAYSNGATTASCDGIYDGRCASTSGLGIVPLTTPSVSTSASSPLSTLAFTTPSSRPPVPSNTATTSRLSTVAGSSSTAGVMSSSTTAPSHSTASTISAASAATAATPRASPSAKTTSVKSSLGIRVVFPGLISALAAALTLSMNL